ncbi:TrkH family potassium uptake protein [Anoxynatronum sibiricum]|uniref:TrkH family potassium uptake protein n=1 Tax=Anoxynatronum sibiricum TaxID=210623 RepID=A0ABU9VU27_9CLOT
MRYQEELRQQYFLVMHTCGTILMGAALLFLLPTLLVLTPLAHLEETVVFLISGTATFAAGAVLRIFFGKRTEALLTFKDGGLIVVLSWVLVILFSAIPFLLSRQLTFTQAIFESTSGWTTTGLSVMNVAETPPIFLLWRSLIQFFGGAGIAVVMLTAIIGPQGIELYSAEGRSDRLLPNVTKSAKMIMMIYSAYCLTGVILYLLAGMPWFDAINHAFAALSTGGFSTETDSIGAYGSLAIEVVSIVLMLLGTTNFAAHYVLLRGGFAKFTRITEIRFMTIWIFASIPLMAYLLLKTMYFSVSDSFRIAIFQATTAISTTGFSTVAYDQWSPGLVLLMVVLMIVGGGTGSTAGGLKLYRGAVLLKSLKWQLQGYFLPPSAVRTRPVYRPDGPFYVDSRHMNELQTFFMLYLLTYLAGVMVMAIHGIPLAEALFEFASTLGTVGLSIGVTSPDLPLVVLWTQIAGMLLGRLELVVMFIVLLKVVKDVRYHITH